LAAKLNIKVKQHIMKRFTFLSAVILILLMVAGASCTTLNSGYDDEYYTTNDRTPNRIYVDDGYNGTIVLEKDPYTGRYYQVSPYGYSSGYNNYNRYNRNYSRNRVYSRNNNGYNYPSNTNTNQQPTEQQRKDWEKKRSEARSKVLGN
jgi:hypothetical protein